MKSIKALYYMPLTLALVAILGIGASATPKTDARIESSIRKSFVYRHNLKDDNITVESKDGVVTLTGSVSEEYQKTLAYEAALAQKGVSSVNDQLQVNPPAPAPESDAWLIGKVKAVLLFHRSVSAADTEVDAKEGIITLRGSAKNEAQKELTAEYAKDVEGVKNVDNELTVSNRPSKAREFDGKMDDASITAEVKLALLFHRSTSAFNTKVETRHGVVNLSGSAKNTAEKDLVEKIVSDVKGVKSVNNGINVE